MSYVWPWHKMNLVPLNGLEAWHCDDSFLGDDSVAADGLMPDLINSRNLTASANKPVLSAELADVNSQRGWYFDGTRDPLVWSGEVTLRHLFVVLSFEEEEFTETRAVMCGLTDTDLIVSLAEGSGFAAAPGESLFLGDGLEEPVAPVASSFSLIELVSSEGFSLDGLRVGSLPDGTALHYGHVIDSLAYSRVLEDPEKIMIRRYIANRYHIWEKTL